MVVSSCKQKDKFHRQQWPLGLPYRGRIGAGAYTNDDGFLLNE
jgi:hypothetical protein